MRLRTSTVSIAIAASALLAAGALAQSSGSAGSPPIQPVPGVKHAGTYHFATGTWTRGESPLARSAYEVLYDNSCDVGYYTALEQQRWVDDGRIPSLSSPRIDQPPMSSGVYEGTSLTGTSSSYEVSWFEIGYCTPLVGTVDVETSFWSCFYACDDATGTAPNATFQVAGLPGGPGGGVLGCWTVSVDLAGTTQSFTLQGDCDGVWDGDPAQDNFGYSYIQLTPDPTASSGPLLAGDPTGGLLSGPSGTGCCVGCNTEFWAGTNVPGTSTKGSGLSDTDFMELHDLVGPGAYVYNGCYWFGCTYPSCPRVDLYMEIQGAAVDPPDEPGIACCCADAGSCNICPCNNQNDGSVGCAGCANGTFTSGARLWGTGEASLTNDTLVLRGERGQPFNSGLFFQGLNNLDCSGIFLADGLRCAGGAVKRIQVRFNGPAGNARTTLSISAHSASLGDVIPPGSTRYYQWWYRDTDDPPCGSGVNDSNSSNGYEVVWLP